MKNYVGTSRASPLFRTALFAGAMIAISPVAFAAQTAAPQQDQNNLSPPPSYLQLAAANGKAMPASANDPTVGVVPTPNATPDSMDFGTLPSAPGTPPAPAGISIPAPPPISALSPDSPVAPNAKEAIPLPPSPAALSSDAVQLATQAEQAAIQAQAQAENDQVKRDREHIEKSFDRAENGLLPLQPDQIRDFMHKLERTQSAAEPPSTGQPKGEVRISTLELDPGVEPPVVNLAAGYVTTITLVDATGQPWPIMDVGIGGNFEITPTQSGTHVIRIMPLTRYGSGDLSVLLKGLPTPIIFRLSAGGPSVDLRYDARVPKAGPNGQAPLIQHSQIEAGDQDMMMVLENAPPAGAKRVKVSGLDARTMVWQLNDKMFVRTPLTMLSPAWSSSVASADGMKVYEIGDAPVILMSDNGAMLRGRMVQEDNNE